MSKNKNSALGILFVLACELLFGFSYLFTKNITNQVSPLTLLSWRFVTGFLFMTFLILFGIVKVNLKSRSIRPLIVMAVLQPVLYFISETVGISLTTTSESSLIIAVLPIMTLIVSSAVLKKKPSRQQVIGITITLAGVLAVVLEKGLQASLNIAGYCILLVSVVSYSLYSVFSEKVHDFTSSEKTYVMMGAGAIVFTLLALAEHAVAGTLKGFLTLFTNAEFAVSILYLGAGCSVIAFLLYNSAISYLGANRTVSFAGLSTIVAIISGVILLKEDFSFTQGAGTVLVLLGVYISNFQPQKMKPHRR